MSIRRFIGLGLLAVASAAGAEVRMENAWVRAVPPVSDSTAAYARIVNAGDEAVTVAAAGVAWAADVELHGPGSDTGSGRGMRPMGTVELAPGEALVLQPGGQHLMFTGVESVPAAGEQVKVCLRVDDGRHCSQVAVHRSAPQ